MRSFNKIICTEAALSDVEFAVPSMANSQSTDAAIDSVPLNSSDFWLSEALDTVSRLPSAKKGPRGPSMAVNGKRGSSTTNVSVGRSLDRLPPSQQPSSSRTQTGKSSRTLSASELTTGQSGSSQPIAVYRTTSTCSVDSVGSSCGRSLATRFTDDPVNRFTFNPKTFDVVLCIDNMETTGGQM